MLEILFLIQRFLPSIGGAENHLFQLAKHLSRNCKISVLTFGSETSSYTVDGINVEAYNGLEIKWGSGFTVLSWNMVNDLIKVHPDIIHAHTYGFAHTDLASLIGNIRGIPVVITTHYDRSEVTSIGKGILRTLYDNLIGRLTLNLATHIITATSYEKALLTSKFSVEDKKVSIIPNGVENSKFRDLPSSGPLISKYQLRGSRVVLFVGRVERKKGLHFLLEAAPRIKARIPNVKFLLVGPDWGYRAELESLASRLGIRDQVIFTGELDEQELLRAYGLCELVILPSLGEATGLTILEAMAAEKPVVASRLPTIAEFVKNGRDGLLFEPGDIKMLEDSVVMVMNNQELKQRLIENGRRIARQRDWSRIAGLVEKIYEQILSQETDIETSSSL